MPFGFACPDLPGDDEFTYFRMTGACMIWHIGTKNWHDAYDYCEDMGDDISKTVRLALPATDLQRLHWGWRNNNF